MASDAKKADFIIAGAEKAGTSSLAASLKAHPRVFMTFPKEISYFEEDSLYRRGEAWLAHYFRDAAPTHQSVGTASVFIMMYEKALQRLRKYNPDVRIIVSLREPVARAYSAYWFARRLGLEDEETFEAAIERELNPKSAAVEHNHRKFTCYLHHGRYAEHLRIIYRYFSQAQVKVLFFNDLRDNFKRTINDVERFLGVAPRDGNLEPLRKNAAAAPIMPWFSRLLYRDYWIKDVIRPLVPRHVRHRARPFLKRLNEKPFVYPPMEPDTRAWLIKLYQESNEQLTALIGRDLSEWKLEASKS